MSWTDYEGHTASTWRLDSFLGMRGSAACFAGSDSAHATALIQLVPAESAESAQMERSWATAQTLAEPHLLRVYESGPVVIGDTRFVYSAVELPDDDVSEILSRRSLTANEVRAIVAAAAGALDYLHGRGLRHGAVRPSNILFAGETPKLSIDTLGPADEAARDLDLHQLGTTITEMFTGETTRQAADRLPPSLQEVAVGCFGGSAAGWTAARVVQAVTRSEPPTAAAAAPQAEARSEPPLTGILRRRWPVLALAVVSLIAILFISRRDAPAPAPAQASAPQSPALPPVEKPSPTRIEQPTFSAKPARSDRSPVWAVIAATYLNYDAAQNRANRMMKQSPGIQAHVYPDNGKGNRYFVVLGSGLSSDAADDLRRRAINLGAPRDAYVTKLREE